MPPILKALIIVAQLPLEVATILLWSFTPQRGADYWYHHDSSGYGYTFGRTPEFWSPVMRFLKYKRRTDLMRKQVVEE